MPVRVVDASAIAAVLFGEPDAEKVGELTSGHQLLASPLISHELANVCLKKLKQGLLDLEVALALLAREARAEIVHQDVDHGAVVRLAHETGLSAYDASYLWLSRHLDAPLVTLDAKLGRAASRG